MATATFERTEKIIWEAQPMQALLISCPYEDVFFGGARGGGKTDGSLGDWIAHQDEYRDLARGIFFRRTYDELEEAQSRATDLFVPLGAEYKVQKRTWFFPNGASLKMRILDNEADANKYQGHSYTWICFEELTNWADPKGIDKLRACLRSGKAVIPKSFRATGNPGGVGHNWVKMRYVDPSPPLAPFYDNEMECWRVYIPSRLEDNAALMENDPEYWKRVKASASGNEELIRAWREGDWDIVAGGMLDDVWHRDTQSIAPFVIPESWRVDRSFDWGSSKPFSVGWWAESDGTTAPNGINYPRGSLFRIAEWYGWNGKPNQGLKMLAKDIAKGIKQREAEMGNMLNGSEVHPGAADSSIFDAENGVCIADDMKAEGVTWTKADKSPGSRKTGWQRLRAYLSASKTGSREYPGLHIFNTCSQWIRTVPVLPRSERDPDDVDTNAEDHIGDESRYKVMSIPEMPLSLSSDEADLLFG